MACRTTLALNDVLSCRDPRLFKSGKSVEKRARIGRGSSRHLRRALYMPALVALRRDPYLRRFYQNLLARGKARLQAVVAGSRHCMESISQFCAFLFASQAKGKRKLAKAVFQQPSLTTVV